VPLLAPPERRALAESRARDIFHGQAWVRQLLQLESEHDANESITRVGSSGSYERMGGTSWTLGWSGDLSYRTGQALEGTRDYDDLILHVYRLSLYRRFVDRSFVRAGRFLPCELPGVGYLDGVQGEKVLDPHLRIGLLAGLKPTRDRLEPSAREPTIVPYVTVEAGAPDGLYFSGTAGVLGSLYEGRPDRLAVLFDETLRLGSRFSLSSTSEVDFDVGGAEFRSGASLTRLDLRSLYVVAPLLELRGGLDHYERPDTQAQRDSMTIVDAGLFDDGYWRYFVGAAHDLPWKLRLSEEVAWIDSDTAGGTFHWSVSLTRLDLPWLPGSSATVTVYDLDGPQARGYGGKVQAFIPVLRGSLSILPSASARSLDISNDSEGFQLADVSLGLRWQVSSAWTVDAGFTRAFGTDIGAYVVDLGITFRW
jgi:hypothetical protein